MKIFKNIIYEESVEEIDMNLSTIVSQEYAITMEENLQNYEHRKQDKKEEMSPLVDGHSHYCAEKDYEEFISEQKVMRR